MPTLDSEPPTAEADEPSVESRADVWQRRSFANTDVRDYGSLERIPGFANTPEKKVLYVLVLNHPRKFCATSLVPVVGEPTTHIRPALESLYREDFLERIRIPSDIQVSSDEYFFRFKESRYTQAKEYFWSSLVS